MCFGSNPTKDSIFFLFLGNLTSTDMFSDEMNLHTWTLQATAILKLLRAAEDWLEPIGVLVRKEQRRTSIIQHGGSSKAIFVLFLVFVIDNDMDFSKFSDDNFDVKEWVNSALRIRDDRTPVDVSFIYCKLI